MRSAGHEEWLEPRHDEVKVKGKGLMRTYFLKTGMGTFSTAESDSCTPSQAGSETLATDAEVCKMERLVEWNCEVLSDLLKKIVARNRRKGKRMSQIQTQASFLGRTDVLDEVKEIIPLPEFDPTIGRNLVDPKNVMLDKDVIEQLHRLISKIGSLYKYVDYCWVFVKFLLATLIMFILLFHPAATTPFIASLMHRTWL